METITILIDKSKFYIYEKVNDEKYYCLNIKGESYFNYKDMGSKEGINKLKTYLLERLNYEDFSNFSFHVIYHDINLALLKEISQHFLPCKIWQIQSLVELLPLLLLKGGHIKPGSKKVVGIESLRYEVFMAKDGIIKVSKTDKSRASIRLAIEEIPNLMEQNYNFTSDEGERKKLIEQVKELKSEIRQMKTEKKN